MSNHVTRQLLSKIKIFTGKATRPSDIRSLVRDMRVVAVEQELIRIGSAGDGGYLLPDDLDGIEYSFSPGVANCSDFELDLAERGMQVFLADRSVDGPASGNPNFHFIKKYAASTNDQIHDLITLDTWYEQTIGTYTNESPEALLQMDIEGCEYQVLHNASNDLLSRFRIIVIEFHKLYQLVDRFSFSWIEPAIRKLLQTHAVVHIHPNNNRHVLCYGGVKIPSTMEITFLRRDRLKPSTKKLSFPHPLDHKCIESKPELTLPDCWYK